MKRSASIDQFISEIVATKVDDAMKPLRAEINKLREEVQAPAPRMGRLFTTNEAMVYVGKRETTFRRLVWSGQIKPVDPDILNGEHHRFARTELDRFLLVPSGEVRTKLAMWQMKKNRIRQEQTPRPDEGEREG